MNYVKSINHNLLFNNQNLLSYSKQSKIYLAKRNIASKLTFETINSNSHDDTDNNENLVPVEHLSTAGSKISPYWIQKMKKLNKPSARQLVSQLTPDNPLGYISSTGIAKKGTLVDYVTQQKRKHPNCVILSRCGEFYETYGTIILKTDFKIIKNLRKMIKMFKK
jgi:hypothetical protein